MSDFLRNLRSSHKKDPSSPRRSLDGHYYPQTERRRTPDRRSNYTDDLNTMWTCLNDTLPQLIDNASQLVMAVEKRTQDDTPLIEAKIRQCNAIASFFDNLNNLISNQESPFIGDAQPKAAASYTAGTYYTKEDILTIIRNMRKEGATFAIIADYLKDKGIPTFSGRGEWHAQTIHRLCK